MNEKEAIEKLRDFIELLRFEPEDNPKAFLELNSDFQRKQALAIETVLNLLEKKDKIIDELSTMVFDSRNLTFVDDKQFKGIKKEIIKYAEEQATGKLCKTIF